MVTTHAGSTSSYVPNAMGGHAMSPRGTCRVAARSTLLVALLFAASLVGGCGGWPGSAPQCTGGLQSYEDTCLSQATVEYLQCTKNRGFDVATEIDTAAGGSFKAVANASLEVAHKKSQQENTPVALQIVEDCAEFAKDSGAAGQEQAELTQFQQQADKSLNEFEKSSLTRTASITLSTTSAHVGEQVRVEGRQFQPNETVDIEVDIQQVARVTADATGSFSATITIPDDVVVQSPTHEIQAIGRTSARSDGLPLEILP